MDHGGVVCSVDSGAVKFDGWIVQGGSMNQNILYCVDAELAFARQKFPGNRLMFAALVEEVGELAQALIDHSLGKQTHEQVFNEAVQVICMALRVAEEGSEEFKYVYDDLDYRTFNVHKK